MKMEREGAADAIPKGFVRLRWRLENDIDRVCPRSGGGWDWRFAHLARDGGDEDVRLDY